MKETEHKWGIDKLLFNPIYVLSNVMNAAKSPKLMETPRIYTGYLVHTINLAEYCGTSIRQAANLLSKIKMVWVCLEEVHLLQCFEGKARTTVV